MNRKSVLVTGCSAGGLGYALATAFYNAGLHVFATARDPTKVPEPFKDTKKLAELDNHGEWEVIPLNVTSQESLDSCVRQVVEKTGGRGLDVLVNNAGGAIFGPLAHASIEEARRVYDVNVWGLLAVTKEFVPLLVQAEGVIVNISSIAGAVPLAWQGIYNSSKAAVTHLSETFRIELAPLGVRVVTAMVGSVDTQIYQKYDVAMPADSWYKSVEPFIKNQSRGKFQEQFNEPIDQVAHNLVADTLKGRQGKIWRGGDAGMAKYASWLLPTWLFERILHQGRGIYELKRSK
ncbi:NADPH-dependent 1-acyldihydroxyacetone phosphate reductase [Cytospora mali]|uniref:NADPH-dependent 1-acyldihydroxyacetone phosphate reductase n=1 Tax=Cytospora mali TaxID=578113 RepID=A0A194VZH0_CYTMA|nr:NADPH-dependent 1-acyldihydroxyacetone phosphate reductase [Valsa mali]